MRRSNLAVILCLLAPLSARAQLIHTYAGGGPNNTTAASANLNQPIRVILDTSGNYYFAAYGQHRIFKVDGTGTLIVVAGNGTPGFSGDGGPATSASLNSPVGLTLDAVGNLYIADYVNHRVRKVDATTHNISTVAGTGAVGYNGDGIPATSASLYYPIAVAVDASGNLYIDDQENHRIRKVDATTHNISTVAGTGGYGYNGDGFAATSATLSFTFDVTLDAIGNLYIADVGNHRIRKVDAATHNISTVVGNGSAGYNGDGIAATSASLYDPTGLAFDASGNLYIADQSNQRIRKVNTSGIISTVAGNGGAGYNGSGILATSAYLDYPWGVAADSTGQVYIADRFNNRVRKVDATGEIFDVAGNGTPGYSGDGGPATDASLLAPDSVALDGSGNLFIADVANFRIRRLDRSTGKISTVAGNGTYGFGGDGGPATSASISYVFGIGVDKPGNLFIVDSYNHRIRKVDAGTGIISTVAGNGSPGFSGDGGPATAATLDYPSGVAVDGGGNLFIADPNNQRIRRVDALSGIITTVAGNGYFGYGGDGGPAISATLAFPRWAALDHVGNLFVVDALGNRVRRVDASTGIITTVAGDGVAGYNGDGIAATSAYLNVPLVVALDSADNFYIVDFSNQRIRRVDASTGIISTVAGNGIYGFSGDGGAATSASLAGPEGVAIDGFGNVFIADYFNQRIREVDALPALGLSSASLDFGHVPYGTTSPPQGVTITNTGGGSLRVSTVSASGDFLETDNCTASPLASGGSCIVNVSFLPTATGARTGMLTINDNAPGSPHTVSLTGTGDPASQTITFGALTAKTYGDTDFSVSATADSGLAVSFAAAGNCTVAGSTVHVTGAGSCTITASQAGNSNYLAATDVPQSFNISKATPTITWANPAAITYGTGLGAGQLNATASVGGTLSYTPGSGTVLGAGNGQTLSVNFTPTDTSNYNSAMKSVTISVNRAPLTITANSASKILDAANPPFSATYSGFVNGEGPGALTGTLSCTTAATTTSPVRSYSINCSGQSSSNYAMTYKPGTLAVNYASGGVCDGDVGHSILQPINANGTSVWKRGGTVPAKFRVCDANGVSVGTPGVVSSFYLSGIFSGTLTTVDETPLSTTPDSAFRWDATGQQWIFNISTSNLASGQTYLYTILLNDGSAISFQYGLK